MSEVIQIHGYGKRTDVDSYRLQYRGGKGVINMKSSAIDTESSARSPPLSALHR